MIALSKMDDRPSEMIHLAMIRGKMCEMLAEKSGLKPLESFFTVGLFSALDILMERDIETIIAPLPLSDEVENALLKHEGILGEALKCALAYEVADFDNISFQNLTENDFFIANVEAVSWANMAIDV